jgi:hypothetical protein
LSVQFPFSFVLLEIVGTQQWILRQLKQGYPFFYQWLDHYFIYLLFIIGGVELSPYVLLKSLGTAATSGLLYKPQMIDEGDCGAIGGMKIGRGNRSTERKPAPAPLCPPQNPT